MNTIWIMALEPIETRYTCQWFNGLPELLFTEIAKRDIPMNVVNVAGEQVETGTTDGAFLDFAATNIWKNTQLNKMAVKFSNGDIKAGDKFLFTDAWHPGIIQIKYMSELLDIPVEIHSMWHAGSYDPQDFLGRLIKDKRWTTNFERSIYFASDYNYFATQFHYNLFVNGLGLHTSYFENVILSGQPHNKLVEELAKFDDLEKEDLILFPHRLAPEKQLDIFKDLAANMPQYDWVVCQEQNLSKEEYHTLLGKSKIVFSANLQETLGISSMEAILVNSFPLLPDRLSYTEMYESQYRYPSDWTENFDQYTANKEHLMAEIKHIMEGPHDFQSQKERLLKDYLYPGPMIDRLLN